MSITNVIAITYAPILAHHLFHKHLQKPLGAQPWSPRTRRKRVGQASRYFAVVPRRFANFVLLGTISASLGAAMGLRVAPALGQKRSESG